MTIIETLLIRKTPLTPKEAAEYLGLNERTVRRWLQSGRLKGYRPDGENWRLDPAHVAAYIHECGNW
jgi:excisionase family DNA binding protein